MVSIQERVMMARVQYFVQPMDLKDFSVLFFLLKCVFHFSGDVSQPQVLIAVQSGPKNKELRNEVRRTWGGACKTVHQSWCSVIFVLGKVNSVQEACIKCFAITC